MNLETSFLVASFFIGIAQLVDGILLARADGSLSRRRHLYFAFLEYVWAGICAYLLSVFSAGWLFLLALSFVIYVAVSFIYGLAWASRMAQVSGPPTYVPMVSVYLAILFGIVYAVAALLLLVAA